MPKSKQSYTIKQVLSSVFMMLALLWLTVCLPYVNEERQANDTYIENPGEDTTENESPLTNTTEEKTESGTSLPSEYLHHIHVTEHNFITLSSFFKCHPSDLYHAFHPDMIIPPPEV